MNRIFNIFYCLLFVFSACNNQKSEDAEYAEILSLPPFAGLTDSIRLEPSNDLLYFRRAVLLNTNDYPEPALEDFRKAWSLQKNERYAFGFANLLLEKKTDSAVLFLKEAVKELPNSFLLQLTLARSLTMQHKTDEALVLCNEILEKNPEQVDVLKMKADILEQKGDKRGTIETLGKAYSLTPQDIELNYMYALKLADDRNDRVIRLCDSLIKVDSLGLHAEPYYYKGIYFSNSGDKVKALALFDQALTVDYNFLDAYIEKGGVLFEQKKFKEALDVFNLCLRVSPKFADAYYWIAKSQEALGQKPEARQNYERAWNLDKEMTEAKEAAERLKG